MERFKGEDFMFILNREEKEKVLLSKKLTAKSGRGGDRRLPYAFTESGIYMLMTVLKGELAIRQSRTLIKTFRAMKDYIIEANNTLAYRDNLQLAIQVSKNSQSISALESKDHKIITEVKRIDEGLKAVTKKMKHMVTKSDLPPIFLDFNRTTETREYLLLNGEPIKAKDAYLEIYKHAKSKIYIIDNYISIKTLHLLQIVKRNLEITFFTDNANKYLRKSDLDDFKTERPDLKINFIKTNQTIHDRFIILDEEKIYQSGGSSKDIGNKLTSIHEINDEFIKQTLLNITQKLKQNPKLILK